MSTVALDESALDLRFTHAFDIRINFDKRWLIGPVSGGANVGYTSVGAGCTVSGPRLNGKLVDYSGADWPIVRPDGVVELDAHYMIEAADGARIYIRNMGYVHGPLPPDIPHTSVAHPTSAHPRPARLAESDGGRRCRTA